MKYMRWYVFIVIMLLSLFQSNRAGANNLRIRGDVRVLAENITNPGNVATFSFTVEWDNSWRDMFNYDAAYIFLKYKVNEPGEEWHNLYLMSSGNELSSDKFSMDLKNTTSSVNKNEGFFLYRNKNNQGTGVSSVQVTAKWLISGNPDKVLRIADFEEGKVMMMAMGVEMVYVPRGAFRAGDTDPKTVSHFRNNYLPIPEKYDIISRQCTFRSSSPVAPGYPDPFLPANRVNDLSAVKGVGGYPSNAWYGDKIGSGTGYQYWSVKFKNPLCVKYLAIESVPGYAPSVWEFQGQASADVDKWTSLYRGNAADWETSLTRTYPPTKAFRVNPENKSFAAYRIYVEQSDMPGGASGNPPLIKNVAMTTEDLSLLIDNSVIINAPITPMGGQRGLTADDKDQWSGVTDVNYPNGYPAFYVMKYEISQEQYVSFLNKLTPDQQRARTIGAKIENLEEGDYIFGDRKKISCRNGIRLVKHSRNKEPMIFDVYGANTGPTLACNYLNPSDMLAYADWTGLRPMTELEYEKICRAFYPTGAVRGEYPWNTTSIEPLTALRDNGQRTEQPVSGAENVNTGGLQAGPVRCGAFSVGAANRAQMGASFWGVMEAGGNLAEIYYNANTEGRLFRGILSNQHGDGKILKNGNTNVSEYLWPIHHDAFCLKGGHWADTSKLRIRTSDRSRHWGVYKNMDLTRLDSTVTFRLGHTAPQVTFRTNLMLQNGMSTQYGEAADTVCNGDIYTIKATLPEELKDDLYSVVWYVSENKGKTWDPLEGEGNQNLTLTKLWNINTDEDIIKEYWVRKEIYGLSGDALSDKAILYVLNDSTYLNRLRDTLDAYDHSTGVLVNVSQAAQFQWIFGDKEKDVAHVLKKNKTEMAAPYYNSLQSGDTWYLLRSVFENHCVALDTISIHVLPAPVEQLSPDVRCGETMIDSRDQKRYRTALVGRQCWMADNLNYYVQDSRCYGDRYENCDVYGRLYSWAQAVGQWSADKVQGACPEGWHIPNTNEWVELQKVSGQKLRSQLNLWNFNTKETMADNDSRFSARPGGARFFSYSASIGSALLGYRMGYYDLGTKAWWWSSGFDVRSYTSRSSAAVANINIPVYATLDNKNMQTIGTYGANSLFYGDTPYLGNSATVDASAKFNAMDAVENNFFFNVRCVKD